MLLPDGATKDLVPEWFEDGESIRVADAFIVDIVLNVNGQTFDTLRQYGETIVLEGLLLTKQTLRDKDAADRAVIERALQVLRSERGRDSGGEQP
jgi:hypothetical protein